MQLVLELLKKIFVALQGVYTKAESDAALAEIDLQRVMDAQASRNVVMKNILTIAKTPVDNVHPLLLMGDFSSRIGSVNTTTGQISGFVNETMPQSDGTFVVTNRVSGGPLELSEDGTAPNHAVSLGQLTEEAQAREQADAKHDAELDWLKTAVDGDWKIYMLGRAAMTGKQKNIDTVNRAIKEHGEDSTATLPNRMIEDWTNLYVGYEAWILSLGKKSPLKSAFWEEYFLALELWEADPTNTTWTATTNPYASQPRTSPIVDLKVEKILPSGNKTTFNRGTNAIVYFPALKSFSNGFENAEQNSPVIIPNVTNNVRVLYWGGNTSLCRLSDVDFRFDNATTMQLAFTNQAIFTGKVFAPNAGLWSNAFSGCRTYDNAVDMRSAHSAGNAFVNTAMSPRNIAKTLDSLPNNPMGLSGSATGVITFSRHDGTKLAPLMAESPYKESVDSAVAKGWTVQFDQ